MRRCAAGNTSHLAASGIMHPHLLPGAGRCLSLVSMCWHPCGLFIHLAPRHWRDYKPIRSLEHSFPQFMLEGQLKFQSQICLANSLGDSPGINKPWCGRSLYSGRNSQTRVCKPPTSCQDMLRSQFLKVMTNLSAIPFVSGRWR